MEGMMEDLHGNILPTKPRDPQIQVVFQPVVGHAMFHVFKQRQATKSADQVAHKPIKLRFVD